MENQVNWILISILSTSYLNSMILMRSTFELLINITTEFEDAGMKKRIGGISFFSSNEKNEIFKFWKHLCDWNHPYREWINNICPIFISHKPLYHPRLFKITITSLEKLMDIYLVIAKEHYGMNMNKFNELKKSAPLDLSYYPLFSKRFS